MTGPKTLILSREQLADEIAGSGTPPVPAPLPISPWLAMSLLQKAIRRGEERHALRAAATLLRDAPDRLWRRLGCIAFEDIGIADIEAVCLTTSALKGRTFRAQIRGELLVAAFLVSRMCRAPKCRSSDDLLMFVESHPSLRHARSELVHLTTRDLLRIAFGSDPLPLRALALWFAVGTSRWNTKHLPARRGDRRQVFDTLRQAGAPGDVVDIAEEGFRRTGVALCPFVALLSLQAPQDARTLIDDDMPAEAMIGDVPGWAHDIHSREGRAAFARFLEGSSVLAQWIGEHIPPARRVSFLGGLVFRVEGQKVRRRLRWAVGDDLRCSVDAECQGQFWTSGGELLRLMNDGLPRLQQARWNAHVCSTPMDAEQT